MSQPAAISHFPPSGIDTPARLSLRVGRVWETLQTIDTPAANVKFHLIDRPQPESDLARSVRLENWDKALQAKLELLSKVNPDSKFIIAFHEATAQNALYEQLPEGNLIAKMWDGTTISTTQMQLSENKGMYSLDVYKIRYSEWTSCTDPRYCALNPAPCGVGVCVMIETTDGFVVLTRRGIETPVYPARLHTVGGGPKPGEDSAESLFGEILEETGLQAGKHFDPEQMIIMAYVSDVEHQGSALQRPELVAYLPLKIDSNTVRDIRDAEILRKKTPEADVWALEFVSSRIRDMEGTMILRGPEMCPPTEAGLAHMIRLKLAQDSSSASSADAVLGRVMERAAGFLRLPYTPRIQALGRYDI